MWMLQLRMSVMGMCVMIRGSEMTIFRFVVDLESISVGLTVGQEDVVV